LITDPPAAPELLLLATDTIGWLPPATLEVVVI
jgi:hypothetical protein